MGRGMDVAFHNMREQVKTMDYELGKRIPYAFADGLAGAMTEAINGAKDLKEALRDAAINFLSMIQQAMMQKMAYQMVGAMGFSRGGNVRNYSRGGGVPAMVSNGEYVMSREAVNKYGGSFMHGLNAGGGVPGFSGGGAAPGSAKAANFGGARAYDSGRKYQSMPMSAMFYAGQTQTMGMQEDAEKIQEIISEEERKRQEDLQKRLEKKAKKRQLLGMVLGIAASSMVSKGLDIAAGKGWLGRSAQSGATLAKAGVPSSSASWLERKGLGTQESSQLLIEAKRGVPWAVNKLNSITGSQAASLNLIGMPDKIVPGGWMGAANPAPLTNSLGEYFKAPASGSLRSTFGGTYLDGYRNGYAGGGHVSGKSGIDQIPAMLSEGEYVIRASSARQIGKPMLDRINAGKFNDGGPVGEIASSSETGSTSGNTNNINISINMERGKATQENKDQGSSSQNSIDSSKNESDNAQLAERIKQQVVAVIVEEQRPGGLLSE